MTRKEIVTNVQKYFDVRELVCTHVYTRFGESSWQFLRTELLANILFLREHIGKPFTVNTWHRNGKFDERGYRCNMCSIVREKTKSMQLYVSAHTNGSAVDFDVQGMTAEEVRNVIRSVTLPYPARIERDVSWVHLDCYDYLNGKNLNEFNG